MVPPLLDGRHTFPPWWYCIIGFKNRNKITSSIPRLSHWLDFLGGDYNTPFILNMNVLHAVRANPCVMTPTLVLLREVAQQLVRFTSTAGDTENMNRTMSTTGEEAGGVP